MIDIAFSKLAIIGVAALVFIGPERLPKVARMAGTLLGRAQRYINDVKSEVSREIELDDLRKMQKEMQDAATSVEQTVAENLADAERSLNTTWESSSDLSAGDQLAEPPSPNQITVKAKNFRKKKLARTSAVPAWYKRQSGHKSHVISGAARVAKYRPANAGKSTAFFS